MSPDDARRVCAGAGAGDFGPWAETGLATTSGEKGPPNPSARPGRHRVHLVNFGGGGAQDAAVGSELSHAVVTVTKWPVFLQQFAKAPSLYNELHKEAAPDIPAAGLSLDRTTLRLRLKEASPAQRRDMLTAFVLEQAMKTLGITSPIDTGRPLAEFGLDSLMSVTLLNRLEVPLGVKVSAAKLIQGPSVQQLADDLSSRMGARRVRSCPGSEAGAGFGRKLADSCRAKATLLGFVYSAFLSPAAVQRSFGLGRQPSTRRLRLSRSNPPEDWAASRKDRYRMSTSSSISWFSRCGDFWIVPSHSSVTVWGDWFMQRNRPPPHTIHSTKLIGPVTCLFLAREAARSDR